MIDLEQLKIYLPKFLSPDSERELFEGLRNFPENIDSRFYTSKLTTSDILYQGDGLKNMLVVNLPDLTANAIPSIILSNTCDISLNNTRNSPARVVYAPILSLSKYRDKLIKNDYKTAEQIDSHIQSIKRQEITQILFLPEQNTILGESIVFLDRVNNAPNVLVDRNQLPEDRIFTLSDYGAYLLVLKLSIHFSRVKDGVDRGSDNATTVPL